jgi:hypothetical protein
MDAVLAAMAGQRPLPDTSYTAPPGSIMVRDDGPEQCLNVSQIARVREVAQRPNLR